SQIIHFHGYPSEEHEVLTDDGYFLSMNRIPYGREDAGNRGLKLPVLLQHGLFLDGTSWISNFPSTSLAFILADAGYDVWLGNSRGNSWSRRHMNLSTDQEEFWDFSFHEMAIYDLPAMINFILQKTGQQKLYYIGHSQGSSIGFIAFSALPQMAEKIKMFFALAPAYTFHNAKGPVLSLFYLPDKILKVIFGTKEACLLGRKQKASLAKACSCQLLNKLCADGFFLVGGFNKKNLNASRTDVYISHFPDYTSVKNFIHWGQTAKTGEFKQFDYGKKNQEKYHQPSPPFYRIEDMTVPMAVWSGGQDWVSPTREMKRLFPRIPNLIHHEHFPDWNHFDQIWGLDAPQRMYRKIIDLMEKSQ
ncbi:LIPM Lipase, partial [Nothoprocta pentlandii]|nr:LIPM Lipase [Nothoprocta pentlandii]